VADGGITEAAILAAMAGGSTAAAAAPAVTATALTAAELAAAATATASTVGSAAAAVAPEIVAASVAPTIAASAAAAAPEVVATSLLPEAVTAAAAPEVVATSLLPEAAVAPETLFLAPTEAVTETAPGLLGPAAETGAVTPEAYVPVVDSGTWGVPAEATTFGDTGTFGAGPERGIFEQLGNWWSTSSTGDKLKAGGELLSGVGTAGTAAKAASPEPGPNKTKTIAQGKVGQPSGGERALAEIVEAMLRRKDAYNKGRLGGAPVLYQPRGLLG